MHVATAQQWKLIKTLTETSIHLSPEDTCSSPLGLAIGPR